MSTYCVTFRIANETIGGKTYDQRRQSIVDAVYEDRGGYWDETTSFFLIGSSLGTSAFGKKASAGLSAAKDMLVVFDPKDMSMAYFGAVKDSDILGSFFTSAHKL